MKITLITKESVCTLALLLASHTAAANQQSHITNNVIVSTSLGLLNSESREFVYNVPGNGRKLSQLDWKAKNTPIIKAEVSWNFLSRLTLSARGWSTLTSSHGLMDDYDWLNSKQTQWSHWSHHEKSNLNYANEMDVNAKFWFLQQHNYRISLMYGYQRYNNSWTAYGGHSNYTKPQPDEVAGLGYKQKFDMPYVGLASHYRYQDYEFNTLVKYSRWVNAQGHDEHYLRNLSFKDSSKKSRYYGIVINAGYYITNNTKLLIEAAWNRYSEGKGGTQILDRTTGASAKFSEGSGISHQNQSISVGLQYTF
ncbi:omptin family outer membrane protease [Yersinia vastinensis]|uniref:omptin family outer membrane protease n=1 Tax=Yersinia vastinensis TaxID=2890318 RepID=UPI0005E0F603|nr:omptin family outer membrane protease [Yersinia vastinensis]OVZ97878.1 protease [Yersinia frederiksenii]CNI69791.1 peptidase A26 omptin [Yersinia frederiksenii]